MQHRRNSWFMPIVTVVAVAVAIVLSFIGSGALGGTPISEAAGGALSADATPFAPAGPAFSIWSIVYLGLIVYAVYQVLRRQRGSARQAALRPWAAASALLNAGWILTVQAGSVLASVAVIVVLLVVLLRILIILKTTRPTSWVDTLVVDGTFGLYLGWVCVATTANIAAWVATTGLDTFPGWQWAAVGILVVVLFIGSALALHSEGRIAPALAIAWGLSWIAVARTSGEFASPMVVWSAAIAAALVLVGTVLVRLLNGQSQNSSDR